VQQQECAHSSLCHPRTIAHPERTRARAAISKPGPLPPSPVKGKVGSVVDGGSVTEVVTTTVVVVLSGTVVVVDEGADVVVVGEVVVVVSGTVVLVVTTVVLVVGTTVVTVVEVDATVVVVAGLWHFSTLSHDRLPCGGG